MKKNEVIDIIKKSFNHFIYEENIRINNVFVYLYIPSLEMVLVDNGVCLYDYLNIELKDNNNDIGEIINDILLTRNFVPLFEGE